MNIELGKGSIVYFEEECCSFEEFLRPLSSAEVSDVLKLLTNLNKEELTGGHIVKVVKFYYTNPKTEEECVIPITFELRVKKGK